MTQEREFADRRVSVQGLRRFMVGALSLTGAPQADAEFIADSILSAEMTGHECHGVRRFPEYIRQWQEGIANPAAKPRIECDNGATLMLDGDRGFGHVVMREATDLAIDRARRFGVSAVTVRRSEAAGRLYDFCARAAQQGFITLIFVTDSGGCQEVAPPGGLEARMSTNPIAFGVPRAEGRHLILDMATSSVAFGRLSEMRERGEPVPEDWVNSVGALRHFGGVKGFGLAVIVEALAGALSCGGTISASPASEDQAALIVAIDVERFRPIAEYTSEVDALASYVKDVPLEAGALPVRLPGEGHHGNAEHVARHGILLRSFVQQRLVEVTTPLDAALFDSLL